jgi:hypothetical protein
VMLEKNKNEVVIRNKKFRCIIVNPFCYNNNDLSYKIFNTFQVKFNLPE